MTNRHALCWIAGLSLSIGQPVLRCAADDDAPLVWLQSGDLPIIFSAPHGGRREIPSVPERTGAGLPSSAGKYVVLRDTGTAELARELTRMLELRFGRRPYCVIAESHRRFLDPNRPPEGAYEHPAAAVVYRHYHEALTGYCEAVRLRYPAGLLIDLHGQATAANTVFRGTQNGSTVPLLIQRFGAAAHDGPHSLCGRLRQHGWTVHPEPLTAREADAFDGGYIVRTYGQAARGIDAIQLEFGADYRRISQRSRVAAELANAIAEYAEAFLDVDVPAAAIRPPGVPRVQSNTEVRN